MDFSTSIKVTDNWSNRILADLYCYNSSCYLLFACSRLHGNLQKKRVYWSSIRYLISFPYYKF